MESRNVYESSFLSNAQRSASRAAFLRKTYLNLAFAILAFVGIEGLLMQWQPAIELAQTMVSGRNWLVVLFAFMGISWLANTWALQPSSIGKQYAGLYLYVAAEAVVFLPLLLFANAIAPDTIGQAAILTLSLVGGLTAVVFLTGKDFSFLGAFLSMGFFVSLGVIVCALIFGWQLGLWFSLAMAGFAAVAVLYQTGATVYRYDESQYVAAALGLFASLAMLFWYILQILLNNRR